MAVFPGECLQLSATEKGKEAFLQFAMTEGQTVLCFYPKDEDTEIMVFL